MGWHRVINYEDEENVEKIAEMFEAIIPTDCLIRGKYLSECFMSNDEFEFWRKEWLNDNLFDVYDEFEKIMEKNYGKFEDNFEPFMIEYTGSAVTERYERLAERWRNIIWLLDKENGYHVKLHYVLKFMNGYGEKYKETLIDRILGTFSIIFIIIIIVIVFLIKGVINEI